MIERMCAALCTSLFSRKSAKEGGDREARNIVRRVQELLELTPSIPTRASSIDEVELNSVAQMPTLQETAPALSRKAQIASDANSVIQRLK